MLAQTASVYGGRSESSTKGQTDSIDPYETFDRLDLLAKVLTLWLRLIGSKEVMNRRGLIVLLGGTASTWPFASRAQPSKTIPRIGVLWHAGSADEEAIYIRALNQGFSDLGYVDGKSIALEHRFPDERPERFASMAAELAAIPVDVLVAVTQPAALAAARATKKIPIVFTHVPDPLNAKLVTSLAQPGGNITGLTNIAAQIASKRVQLLKEAFPLMRRITLLVNPSDDQAMSRFVDEAKTSAIALGLEVQTVEVRSVGEFEDGFKRMVDNGSEGLITMPNGLFYQGRLRAGQLAIAHKIPFMVVSRETLEGGALMSYGPDFQAIFRRTAVYVDKILKGEKTAQLPVELPTKFQFLVNLKTAKALGVTISESFLLRADEVIE
jgi:putative ABC transport system substrate-binding protein